ncbi:hypothetical protein C5167_001694 [Papaver somniferum]|uniref:Bowman-Birk serine protease inhibitors family domain-containing protein n=1 Tax=Papaver somniferum TaxID=3469 RepID=A0A4Y7KX50_PAPSO|nr:hypothetical protein C5167_001694 [Papaver somniferum]
MEGGGKKSFIRMIRIVLLIVGMFLGQISASRKSEITCFGKCFGDCMFPDPGDGHLAIKCDDKCDACFKKSPPGSHSKTLGKLIDGRRSFTAEE